jgi:hypothetical protein
LVPQSFGCALRYPLHPAKIKYCHRIHTRYDRCVHALMSAIGIDVPLNFSLNQSFLALGFGSRELTIE